MASHNDPGGDTVCPGYVTRVEVTSLASRLDERDEICSHWKCLVLQLPRYLSLGLQALILTL